MPEAWQQWLEDTPLDPPLDPGGRVVVLSAHPDDEVLAVGAWLAGQAGRPLALVTATDGEASHPGSRSISPEELRTRRPHELALAMTRLGHRDPEIHRLGLPDGGLTEAEPELRRELTRLLDGAALVLAPYEADGHPDHDALGAAARAVCPPTATLWRFPIWTWAWTRPSDQPWLASARRLPAGPDAHDRKRSAIEAFVTQVEPVGPDPADEAVVGGALLRHALHAPEVVIV